MASKVSDYVPTDGTVLLNQGQTIQLQRGQPNHALVGAHLIAEATAEVFTSHAVNATALLNYGDYRGPRGFREAVAAFLNAELAPARPADASEFFATAGNSHAIDTVCWLLHRGRRAAKEPYTIVVETPTYPFAVLSLREDGGHLAAVARDADGQLDMGALRTCVQGARAAGRPVTMMYVIPSFHNPTGTSMTHDRRAQLVSMAHQLDFFVVCDDVYQLLHFEGCARAPQPLVCFEDSVPPDQCRVLSLGSLSKLLAPSLRSGWIQTRNTALFASLEVQGQLNSGGGFSSFTNAIVTQMMDSGRLAQHVANVRRILRQRSLAMLEVLQRHTDVVSFVAPSGGYFFWVTILDASVSADAVLARSLADPRNPTRFFTGPLFSMDEHQRHTNVLRLSFAFYEADVLVAGCQTVMAAIRAEMEKPVH